MKKIYVKPSVEVLHINHQTAILQGSENDHADAKENNLIWEEESTEEDGLLEHKNIWED